MLARMTVQVFDERSCRLGEGPWFDERTGRAGWVDILGRLVLWQEVAGGRTGSLATPTHVGAAVPRENGGLVLCLRDGPVLHDPDGTRQPLGTFADADEAAGQPPAADAPSRRANDAKADPFGRLWLGTMAYDTTAQAAALYRLDPGADRPVRVLDGITVSNGLGWSPDGSLMYYIDTPTRNIDVFDYDGAAGAISSRRTLVTVAADAGFPDGMCVDAHGAIWVALWSGGAVRRYRPDGSLDRVVEVGVPLVTSCAFAGERFDHLLITTARTDQDGPGEGMTYVHRPGDVTGAPVHRYAG
jgi:sugar lactone lactonase YvrE